jgi:hypothetical protein
LEQFTTHFPRSAEQPTVREQGVKDPKVLALAHKNKWVILTTDHHMREKHKEEFTRYTEAMVVSTAHREGGDEVWIQAFIKAKARIERLHKKQSRPWCAQINHDGEITVCKRMGRESEKPKFLKSAKKSKKK